MGAGRVAVLRADKITKEFREGGDVLRVLNGASLSLEQGEVVLLEGPSGSGKTTLLSILGFILTPTAGRVEIDGQQLSGAKPKQLARMRKRYIGFVFQQYNLIPALTALENVEYALNIRGIGGDEAKAEASRALGEVGLDDKADSLPRDLSGGQKQRVAIARALAGNAPILLIDEPTANLDTQTGEQVMGLFRRLSKQQNRAMLIVTHDAKLRAVADRALAIRDGCILN